MTAYPKIYLYKRIVQAKLFMDDHFAEHIELGSIAGEASFSMFHFSRLFKTIYGKTPHQYLTGVRMEKAKALLQQGLPVTEVCFMVGFESASSFTGLFKRYVRLSPSHYRKIALHRQEQIRKVPLQFVPNCFAEQKGWTQKSNFEEVR